MAQNARFHAYVEELFAGLGPITIRKFFGGAGAYAEGAMFALLSSEETIYLKADGALKTDLAREGSSAFLWTPKSGPRAGETVDLGYWRLPEAALDDPDQAAEWGRRALAVARAKRARPKTRPSRRAREVRAPIGR